MKRSKQIPHLLLVSLVAAQTACETQAHKDRYAQQKADWEAQEAKRVDLEKRQQEEARQRDFANTYGAIREACAAHLKETQSAFEPRGYSFTPFTPTYVTVTVEGKPAAGQADPKTLLLSAERFEDEQGKGYWRIEELTKERMELASIRYGFSKDIQSIREDPWGEDHHYSHRSYSWFDHYLMWHMLMRRPATVYVPRSAGGPSAPGGWSQFEERTPGTRPYAPSAPLVAGGAYESAAARGIAERMAARPGSSALARVSAFGSATSFSAKGAAVSRGGFGATGAARGGGFGG